MASTRQVHHPPEPHAPPDLYTTRLYTNTCAPESLALGSTCKVSSWSDRLWHTQHLAARQLAGAPLTRCSYCGVRPATPPPLLCPAPHCITSMTAALIRLGSTAAGAGPRACPACTTLPAAVAAKQLAPSHAAAGIPVQERDTLHMPANSSAFPRGLPHRCRCRCMALHMHYYVHHPVVPCCAHGTWG